MFEMSKHSLITLRRSTFGHFFENGEHACAYNALSMAREYFPSRYLNPIRNLENSTASSVLKRVAKPDREAVSGLITRICNSGIVVPADYDETSHYGQVKDFVFNGPRIRVMVLHLTEVCNLKCRYCFVEGQYPSVGKRETMPVNTIRASVNFFARMVADQNFTKPPSIVFYGGEPLVNWQVMKAGLEEIDMLQANGHLTPVLNKIVITNGTLITDEIARTLKEYEVSVAVSIDGPEDIHDSMRVYRGGAGSFAKAMDGIGILKAHGITPTISSVMTKQGINRLEEILDFLIDTIGAKGIGFNHVSIVPDHYPYDPVYEDSFADAILRAREHNEQQHPGTYERRMSPRIRNFRTRSLVKADCTGCGEQFSVSPEGEVGICQGFIGERLTFEGSVYDEDFDPHSEPVFQEWSLRSPLNMSECTNCPALATCGGGCPRNAHALTGSIWNVDKGFCHFARKANEWLIWNVGFSDSDYECAQQ